MHHEADRLRVFSRRALIVGGAQTALFGLLAGRLYQLQVAESDRYALLAEENRVNHRLIMPPRGRIFDRNWDALARNVPTYRVRLVREQTPDVAATLRDLARLIPLSAETIEEVMIEARLQRPFVPVTVRDDLAWDEVARVAVRAPDLPGIALDSGLLREYPHGDLLSHVLGYVGPVNEAEQNDDADPLLRLPEFRIGKSGVERSYEHLLRGEAGLSRVEVNALGREIRELEVHDGVPGQDIALTIDLALQRYCHERLSGELSASAVVVGVDTGEVLALASVPSYDPSAFTNGLSRTTWDELRLNPRTPLVNKCIRGQYPPGSTFKMITALAALEAGVDPHYAAFCPGYMSIGRSRFHCWRRGGHGSISLVQGIAQSCDVYFYDLARKVGVDAIAAMANRFGLGRSLGIDLPGERPGLIPTKAWKLEQIGEPWQKGETLVIGIGQGFVQTTPLQLAIMTARLCNGGVAVEPHVLRSAGGAIQAREAPDVGVSRASMQFVLRGMHEVVNGRRGTARAQKLDIPDITMAGKTGTSQVRRITKAERAAGLRKNEEIPWKERDHALFVAFAPYEAPRYAVAVIVEHGGSGSKAAAPIAKDILQKTLEIDPMGEAPAPAADRTAPTAAGRA